MPEVDPSIMQVPPDPARLAELQAEVETLRRQVSRLETDQAQRNRNDDERLGVLVGGVAHGFNNLLTVILGNASLLETDIPPWAPARALLDKTIQAAHRAADLCQQMLAYSGRGHFVPQDLDLNALLLEVRDLLESSISRRAELRYQLNSRLPPIRADAAQLRQALLNLVLNASEALREQPGQISIATQVASVEGRCLAHSALPADSPGGGCVMLEVVDTGCGMDETVRPHIFDPFFTTKFLGRGLGLAAVLGIVRGHNGAIEVESRPGRGAVFRLFFPPSARESEATADSAGSAGASPSPTPAPAEPAWQGEGTILVVDDEDGVRGVACHLLESFGFQVQQAPSGGAALTQLQQPPPDLRLVLLDLTMPQLDGVQTFRLLRALHPKLPVILMSGYSQADVEARFSDDVPADFLQKPFGRAQLLAVVRRQLEAVSEP